MSIYRFIRQTTPNWFRVDSEGGGKLRGQAYISMPAAADDLRIDLEITASSQFVIVQEATPGTLLPSFCPERHINEGGSFCVGQGVDGMVNSIDAARVWWGLLERYLKLQRVASRTRQWPPRQAMSHGSAADYHSMAVEHAAKLGIVEDWYQMLEGRPLWFSNNSVRLDKSGRRLASGRQPCPVGCLGKRGKPILRRKCCNRDAVVGLIKAEANRRNAEENYWGAFIQAGHKCCGTMDRCPLREANGAV